MKVKDLREDITRQELIILNLQRSCENVIDLANYIIKKYKLGIPKNSRHSFELLVESNIITSNIKDKMRSMVGFRNIVVHDYSSIDLDIIEHIIHDCFY